VRIGGVGTMRRTLWTACTGLALALMSGCAAGSLLELPTTTPAGVVTEAEANPVYVPQGPMSYRKVYEHALDVLTDFGFEILEQSAFDGRIETVPRSEPGLLLFMKPGSPVVYQRLLATFQTYRHRAAILIQPAQAGGFFIHVKVFKELEDLPRPVRATAAAIFRTENNIDRQYTVIDPTVFESAWIPKGRDFDVEQVLLKKLKSGI
jgi:hypothetical protein